MKAIALTDQGLKEFVADEIRDKIDAETEVLECGVRFEADILDVCEFTYTGQSVTRVLAEIGSFEFEDLEDLVEKSRTCFDDFNFSKWLGKDVDFRVVCDRQGEQGFNSPEVEKSLGDVVVEEVEESLDFTPSVSLEEPDVTFYCYVLNDFCCLGIDFAGRDLSQRNYKVYSHPTTVRGDIAYSLVRISEYEKDDKFLDPFCGSAPIVLEAVYHASKVPVHARDRDFAFQNLKPLEGEDWMEWFRNINSRSDLSGLDVNGFDVNLNNLKYGKNNAEIAGMSEVINFSKVGVEWLDTEFNEGEVDVIVTQPPQNTKSKDEDDIEEVYDELFYQADYVLSEDGCIVALMIHTDLFVEAADKHGFSVEEWHEIRTGELEYVILKIEANT